MGSLCCCATRMHGQGRYTGCQESTENMRSNGVHGGRARTHATKDEYVDGRIWLLFITSASERSISASYALSDGYL